jgi:hypothetical protein
VSHECVTAFRHRKRFPARVPYLPRRSGAFIVKPTSRICSAGLLGSRGGHFSLFRRRPSSGSMLRPSLLSSCEPSAHPTPWQHALRAQSPITLPSAITDVDSSPASLETASNATSRRLGPTSSTHARGTQGGGATSWSSLKTRATQVGSSSSS